MSLFSKLFSRDGTPGESTKEDGDASAPTNEVSEGTRKPDDAAVSGGGARDAQAARGRTEQTSVATSNDKTAQGAPPEGASSKQATPAEGTNKIPPLKPGAPPKRERAPSKTMMGMPVMNVGGNPAPKPPQAAAAQAPQPQAAASAAKKPAAPAVDERPKPKIGSGTRPAVELPTAEVPTVEVRTPTLQPERHSNSPSHFDAAFDAAMNALLDSKAPPPLAASNSNAADRAAVSETFADVAKVHAHPLRELMFQLGMGQTPRQWAAASRPVIRPLLDAAQQIGMLELVGALGAFDAALERAAAEPGACISEHTAESLKSAYERLCLQMPETFNAPADSDGRRLILLESLLLQIPSLQRRMLAKLYAAGLSTISQLSQARPDEVSAVAGIAPDVAASVVAHVQRFERERSKIGPSEQKNQAIDRLRTIVSRIAELQTDFELAEADDDVEQKRMARRGRDAALRELDLVLAEIGEVSVIEELKRCPVQAKLRRVTSYLEQLQASA